MISDLILRYLWLHGAGTLAALHDKLMLSFPILETMFHQFRQQQLLEVKGMVGNDYAFTLTGGGRALATARSEVCQYVGTGPGFHPAISQSGKSADGPCAIEPGKSCVRLLPIWCCRIACSIPWGPH